MSLLFIELLKMDQQLVDESTPLIHQQSVRSNSAADFGSQNGYVSFQCPNATGYSPVQHNRSWRAHTNSRSDESSLATLAVDKKMSVPRRTFCLFVTFDLLLTTILWLIEIGSSGGEHGFFKVIDQQVNSFYLSDSLFDLVVLAIARFVFLVTAFAFFRIRHYWPVAVSTAVSDGYFIFKIFAIFVEIGSPPSTAVTLNYPMTIVLILTDFILTWIEVWFVDFKVLPAETKLAQRTAQAFLNNSYQAPVDDSFHNRFNAGRSDLEYGRFYSPTGTAAPSEVGGASVTSMYYSMYGSARLMPNLPPMQQRIVEIGIDGFNKLWQLYENEEIWTVEKSLNNGDVVYSTETPEYGKSFKIICTINDRSPDVILREIILKPEEMPTWNKSVSDVKILQKVGEQTWVTLEVSAPAAMGLIASREFITVRRLEKVGDTYVSAGISTDQCDDVVPNSNFVRGVNGPTGFFLAPSTTEPNSSVFTWILNTDLKGNLSRTLVNKNLTRTMVEFVTGMRNQLQVQ